MCKTKLRKVIFLIICHHIFSCNIQNPSNLNFQTVKTLQTSVIQPNKVLTKYVHNCLKFLIIVYECACVQAQTQCINMCTHLWSVKNPNISDKWSGIYMKLYEKGNQEEPTFQNPMCNAHMQQ